MCIILSMTTLTNIPTFVTTLTVRSVSLPRPQWQIIFISLIDLSLMLSSSPNWFRTINFMRTFRSFQAIYGHISIAKKCIFLCLRYNIYFKMLRIHLINVSLKRRNRTPARLACCIATTRSSSPRVRSLIGDKRFRDFGTMVFHELAISACSLHRLHVQSQIRGRVS